MTRLCCFSPLQIGEDAATDGESGRDGGVHERLGRVLHEAVLGDLGQHLSHGGKFLLVGFERHAVQTAVVLLFGHVTARRRGNFDANRGGND